MLTEPSEIGEVNGLDHIEFADASSSDAFINDSGNLACTSKLAVEWKSVRVYFRNLIPVKAGDSVKLEIKHISGNRVGGYVDLSVANSENASIGTTTTNTQWHSDTAVAVSQTWTATGAASLNRFWFYPRSGTMRGPCEYSIQIYINGEAQFG